MNYLLYIAAAVLLFVLLRIYFRIADRHNIIDRPNERSSHRHVTIRGGGVVVPAGILLWFFLGGMPWPCFTLGLLLIAAVSLVDDIRPLPNRVRISSHVLAVALLAWETGLFDFAWLWWLVAFILIIGTINAFNFMDGINGITPFYALTCLAGFFWINQGHPFTSNDLIIYTALALVIFAFYNARKQAVAFAGDVGSVSIGFILCFIMLQLIIATGNIVWILLFAVYGVDSVLTIVHRLLKKENIFRAHRSHLYQYLANEMGLPHVLVAGIYALMQIMVNAVVIQAVYSEVMHVGWLMALVLFSLGLLYLIAKGLIIRRMSASL